MCDFLCNGTGMLSQEFVSQLICKQQLLVHNSLAKTDSSAIRTVAVLTELTVSTFCPILLRVSHDLVQRPK
jgi:hypothetical protein